MKKKLNIWFVITLGLCIILSLVKKGIHDMYEFSCWLRVSVHDMYEFSCWLWVSVHDMYEFSYWLWVSVHDMYEILLLTASVCTMLRLVSVTGDSAAHRSADCGWLLVLPNERQKPLDRVLHQGVTEWRLRDHRYSNTVVELFLIGFIIFMLHLDRTIYNIHVCKELSNSQHIAGHGTVS